MKTQPSSSKKLDARVLNREWPQLAAERDDLPYERQPDFALVLKRDRGESTGLDGRWQRATEHGRASEAQAGPVL